MSWENHPTFINGWPTDQQIDYVVFLDENGDSSLDYARQLLAIPRAVDDKDDVFFELTACCFSRVDLTDTKKRIIALKNKYWTDGLYLYNGIEKSVCFHSADIRKSKGPFKHSQINRDEFLVELTDFIAKSNFAIASICINKYKHVEQYAYPDNPYDIALEFLYERIIMNFLPTGKTCIFILEARDKPSDKALLNRAVHMLKHGTRYFPAATLSCIKGIYFNPKWCNRVKDRRTYFGLEIADLSGYPIYKYMKTSRKDRAFLVLEGKIMNQGLKKFPA